MEKARAQLEIIRARWPELEKQLARGKRGGYGSKPKKARSGITLDELIKSWTKAISAEHGNYSMAEGSVRRYESIVKSFTGLVRGDRTIDSITAKGISDYATCSMSGSRRSPRFPAETFVPAAVPS